LWTEHNPKAIARSSEGITLAGSWTTVEADFTANFADETPRGRVRCIAKFDPRELRSARSSSHSIEQEFEDG
jgi:hypothetical protein